MCVQFNFLNAHNPPKPRSRPPPRASRQRGDLIFTVHSEPHPRFRRDGANIHYTAKMTLIEALTGMKKKLTLLRCVPWPSPFLHGARPYTRASAAPRIAPLALALALHPRPALRTPHSPFKNPYPALTRTRTLAQWQAAYCQALQGHVQWLPEELSGPRAARD